MKKTISFLLTLCILVGFSTTAFAQTIQLKYDGSNHSYSGNIYALKINGENVTTEVLPIDMNGYSMIPVRAAFEELGAALNWNVKLKKMYITYKDNKIEITENSKNAKLNGKLVVLPIAAKKVNDKLMVPYTFLKDKLNINVDISAADKLITIGAADSKFNVECIFKPAMDTVEISVANLSNYNISRVTDPERIVIDIPNTYSSDAEKKVIFNGNFITNVRYSMLDSTTTRVVLDMIGQYDYTEKVINGKLNISVKSPTYKNIVYHNNGDRVHFILPEALLTDGGETLSKFYIGSYDSTGKIYTMIFSNVQAKLGSGTLKINDSLLESIVITNDILRQETKIVFKGKDKFIFNVITRPDVNDTAITVLKPATKAEKLVVIDAGHGGIESGAVYGGVYEKNLNLDIALRLDRLLKTKNIKTYMMREDDSFVGLYERGYVANSLNAALFLSIHNNALGDPNYDGSMTLYYPQNANDKNFNGKRFAQIVQSNLVSSLKTSDRSIIERPNLVVLKSTFMPAVLAEIGFMTNSQDMNNLMSTTFRQKSAQALCDSIVKALKEVY